MRRPLTKNVPPTPTARTIAVVELITDIFSPRAAVFLTENTVNFVWNMVTRGLRQGEKEAEERGKVGRYKRKNLSCLRAKWKVR